MKKISKIVFSDKELLNEKEMKRVLGGESTSSWCVTGEYLYNCKVSFTGNYSDAKEYGSVCASSSAEAVALTSIAFVEQGMLEKFMITCS